MPVGQQALQFLSELPQLLNLPIDALGLRPIARLKQAPGGLRNLEPSSQRPALDSVSPPSQQWRGETQFFRCYQG
ncbi:MAG: hypothetical protein RLZZ206_1758 [Cyanobacteriota bacterium]|jgi:hypothetical protein